MHLFTTDEATAWCDARKINADLEHGFHYGRPPRRQLDIALQNTVPRLLYAARTLVRLDTRGLYPSSEQYEHEFTGCLLWVTKHDLWSPATEHVGAHIFNRLGVHAGAPAMLDDYPARYFSSTDMVAAEASILQPLLFQWEAYVIPESGNFIARISQHGNISGIIAREVEQLNAAKGVFGQMDVHEAIQAPR